MQGIDVQLHILTGPPVFLLQRRQPCLHVGHS
jgi:hypothetical protein